MGRIRRRGLLQALLLLATSHCATAYNLDPNSTDSITFVAKQMAQDMLSFYSGNQPGGTPGLLPDPYYWWEAGAMMGALVDYWYYTQDDTFVDLTKQGFLFQNSISQACFFALGARLALYTGNSSYADWASRTWDWMVDVKFIDPQSWYVFDGGTIGKDCKDIVPYQWSYNAGGFILGAAAMYNYTEDVKWKNRLDNLLEGVKVFFTGPERNIMTEVACEPVSLCNLDQQSFKAYLSRWLANITKWAPYTYDTVMPLLRASAVAAAQQCTGGANGRMCGLSWNTGKFDGSIGVGQQMAAMEVTLSLMIKDRHAPVTDTTGGTSKGDPGGGGSDIGRVSPSDPNFKKITPGDKFGAAVMTVVVLLTMVLGLVWIFFDETTDKTTMEQLRGFPSSAAAAIAALAAGGYVKKELDEKSPIEGEKRGSAGLPDPPVGISQNSLQGPLSSNRASNTPSAWPGGPSMRSSVISHSGYCDVTDPAEHSVVTGGIALETPSS
ncbi:Mannan endo-1 [Escovopsis weberi]|uniref:mannan endo-1,6-alpha-mannosidase n=1 Tax=Escovopsis weberi TaxID=150374 RepID=A0A0M8N6M9_ESCWE|nr:Mannan endo-1 [Escovopsis weberi]